MPARQLHRAAGTPVSLAPTIRAPEHLDRGAVDVRTLCVRTRSTGPVLLVPARQEGTQIPLGDEGDAPEDQAEHRPHGG